MIIGYTLPNAIEKIRKGEKIHTMREDKKERIKVGMVLDHSTGVRTKKFKKHLQNTCVAIDQVYIDPRKRSIKLNGVELTDFEKQLIIANDGFDTVQAFWDWFSRPCVLRLIQWTDFRYLK